MDAGAVASAKAWPYADFGAPGRVVARRQVADLGVIFVRFANGVRLNIKPTAFRKDQVLVSVRLGDGRLALPRDRLTESWADEALVLGGLGKIDYDDMQQVLASHIVGASAAMTDDAFVLAGATRPQDLDTQLQVLAGYVSDPGFRPSAFARVRSAVVDELAEVDATPQSVFAHEGAWLEHDRDDRWATPDEAQAKAGSPAALEALLKPILTAAPLEVVVVGDVQPAAVIREVAATFGALPPRPAPEPTPAADLAVRFPAGGALPVMLTHKGRADQAIAYEAWPTDGLFADPQESRAVNVAAAVLELRLIDKVRIAEGASYSPAAAANPSEVFPTWGVAYASVETPPAKIAAFYKTVDDITADLAANGPTPDELARAVRPRIETLAKAQQTNEYWLAWVSDADLDPRRLDIVRQTLPGYARLTAADVRKAAGYFNAAKAWRLEVTPTSASTSASVPASVPAAH